MQLAAIEVVEEEEEEEETSFPGSAPARWQPSQHVRVREPEAGRITAEESARRGGKTLDLVSSEAYFIKEHLV